MENFSIDWSDPMAFFTNAAHPQMNGGEVDDEGNDDDFYEAHGDGSSKLNGHPGPGAVEHKVPARPLPSAPTPQADAAKKLENQRRAELLRAKLLASRQNTPAKTPAAAPAMAKVAPSPGNTAAKAPAKPVSPTPVQQEVQFKRQESAADLDLEALLTAGKAEADAQFAATKVALVHEAPVAPTTSVARVATPRNNQAKPHEHSSAESTPPAKCTTNLSDEYYTDLAAWLDLTGYHDADYRNSKLRTYKERKALEKEAARIADKLEQLRQAEQAEMQQLRVGTPAAKAPKMAPPPLPSYIDSPHQAIGTKRGRSPEDTPAEKRQREDNGFRIRGVKESPEQPPASARRGRSPSPGLERRIAYPDARRRSSIDERGLAGGRSRDTSLERRAQYYRRDDEFPRYDHYTPREPVSREPRLCYSSTNGARPSRAAGREPAPSHRPSAGLELKKGGVCYFMIKSWNHQNVEDAQRTNIWATQEKNEEMLTHAFKTSRHVILLFSVNKSMAFQGYALMTSAPDPHIPKPLFTARLNWATSSAFTLRWLAKTPIHFKLVGHLKNTLNYDEERGEPYAVLVGKDGQEICSEAGMGVVEILDDAELESKSGMGKE